MRLPAAAPTVALDLPQPVAPLVRRDAAGRVTVEWPEGRAATVVAPEMVEGWAETVNGLRAQVEHLEAKVGERGKRLMMLGPKLDALAAEVERVRGLADRAIDYAAGLGLQEDDTIRSPLPETIDGFRREVAQS
jgi:hypothetical protein